MYINYNAFLFLLLNYHRVKKSSRGTLRGGFLLLELLVAFIIALLLGTVTILWQKNSIDALAKLQKQLSVLQETSQNLRRMQRDAAYAKRAQSALEQVHLLASIDTFLVLKEPHHFKLVTVRAPDSGLYLMGGVLHEK
ncbi:MAG: type II secretion system protein [Candidatus Babeliales bacterium]